MYRRTYVSALAFITAVVPMASASAEGGSTTALLEMMPADAPVAIVLVNPVKLDQSVAAFMKRVDPSAPVQSLIDGLKGALGIAEWIDFSKPVGIVQSAGGGDRDALLWVRISDFASKVKALSDAREEDGVWHLPFADSDALYVKVRGDYLVVATRKELMARADVTGPSLGDLLKDRMEVFKGRDAILHFNIDSVRPMALGGIAQAKQMAPMLPMMMGQQAGMDLSGMTGVVVALVEAVEQFVAQLDYLELALGIDEQAADLTIAAGFNEGGIRHYLTHRKPAGVNLLSALEAQPFVAAYGYHIPGSESPFFDYLFEKMLSATTVAPTTPTDGSTEAPAAAGDGGAIRAAITTYRDFYRKVEGMSSVVSMSPGGMTITGDCAGSDLPGILELAKKTMAKASSLSQNIPGSPSYESLGSRKIGETTVEEFALKLDTSNPQMAMAAQMWGPQARYALGICGERVRFCLGSAEHTSSAFSGKVSQPLPASPLAKAALAALPSNRNAVLLLDVAPVLGLVGPMMGLPVAGPVPPGPPIAVSASLSGHPARVDIHVPVRAIERIKQAIPSADDPM